jgi:ABC-type uncharacterized transport system substrate-binding protein
MRRREFVGALMNAATVWPSMARARRAVPIIGLLGSATAEEYAPMIATFLKGLSEAGYIQGQNVTFEYAWADHHYERLPMLVSELIERQVKVILAASTPSALAAKLATSTIPIVFAIGGDPVRTGLVGSLSRPDSNVTGATHMNVDTAPKRLELLHELLPGGTSFGLLTNPNNTLTASIERGVRTAAEVLGVQLMALHASTEQELEATLRLVANGLVTGTDSLFTGRISELGARSLQLKVPTIYQYRDFVAAGGAMSYGGDIKDSYYHAGIYVGRILKGEKPADLRVQLSTKVEFFVNLRTFKALGIEPPVALVSRADEVTE